MKKIVLLLLYWFVKFSGILLLFKYFLVKRRISIAVYHNPTKSDFKNHLEYLSKQYNFISLEDYYSALDTKDFSKIPNYALCVTFDDGHKENFNLLELFKKYNLRPTVYICSGVVASNRHFWDSECRMQNRKQYKQITNQHRIQELRKANFFNEREYEDRQALSKDEILQMIPYVDFQSHTKFHPALVNCDHKEKQEELLDSKNKITELTGKPCIHLAYPHGLYDEDVIEIAKSNGYKTARTIDIGWNRSKSNPYKLKALGITDNASFEMLELQLCGIKNYFLYLFRGSFLGHFKL